MSDEAIERISVFLSKRSDGASVTVVDYTPIVGGYSRAMSRFYAEIGGERRGFVMRADPPPGQSILDTDRAFEWSVLEALRNEGSVAIPTPLWFDPDGSELGSPAFISDLIDCDTLHVLANATDAATHPEYTERLAHLIASVHNFPVDQLPPSVDRPASWDAYIDACIQRWRDYEAEHCESEPFMRVVAAWLTAHKPAPAPLTLVHGDYQGPNILVEKSTGRFHKVDWELAHIGDPREDLGWWALAMGSQPPDLIANDQEAYYEAYRRHTGLSEEIVNPQTVAYFTVFSSFLVFSNIAKMTSRLANGENMGSSVAYMTNAMPYMHSAWIAAMRTAGHWNPEGQQ
jgi:aminoglycoside phosphotransferase (APT) family kinase protein